MSSWFLSVIGGEIIRARMEVNANRLQVSASTGTG